MALPVEPVEIFNQWFAEAEKVGIALPTAMALATADGEGRPSVRYVLLKDADESGFSFCTNRLSRKGREIVENPHASIAFYWHEIGRQVRVDGRLSTLSAWRVDEIWSERPRESQLSSLSSEQSTPVSDHQELLKKYSVLEKEYGDREIPCPPDWTCYLLIPEQVEFWTRGDPRLHHRQVFIRNGGNWRQQLLQP